MQILGKPLPPNPINYYFTKPDQTSTKIETNSYSFAKWGLRTLSGRLVKSGSITDLETVIFLNTSFQESEFFDYFVS